MVIAADVGVDINGNIRHISGTDTFTVLELHRYLGALADDAEASGDDLVDITTDTPSDRSTDNIITLNSPFNIDDTMSRFLFDGSITQNDGDDVYSGLEVVGVLVAGTEFMIIQDGKVLPAWWGTGVNANAATQLITSMLVKTRSGGADIDSKKILTKCAELGDQFREFPTTLGLANSVSAVSTAADANNESSDTTLEGYFGNILNTEGQRLIDIDNDTVVEEYYSEWDIGSQTKNDVYEFTKWIQQRAHSADAAIATGTDFTIDDGTILGQGHELSARANNEKLVEMRFRIKIGTGAPTGDLFAELYISDDATPGIPTGGTLATSEPVLGTVITSSYAEVIFRFEDNVTMTGGEDYFAVITHPNGGAGDFFEVEGSVVAGDDNGTRAELTGGWAGQTNDNLNSVIKSSPLHHGRPGETFRGITEEVFYDGESGSAFTENVDVFWGTRITYDGDSGTFEVGRYVTIAALGTPTVAKNGGRILFDDAAGNVLYVSLEDSTGTGSGQLADNDIITQIGGVAASADSTATIVDDDRAGGIGRCLAIDDNTGTGELYLQIIHGSAPVDNLRMSQTLANFNLVFSTVNNRTIFPEFIGTTTGSDITGAYGIGFDTDDVGAGDKFTAFDNVQRSPPNNVTFTVTGLVSGEDRVLVGPRSGSSLVKNQLTTDTNLSSATETLIQCSSAIPTDTPSSGTGADNTRVRVELDTGVYRRVQYDSFSGDDFSITVGPDDDWTGSNLSTQPKDVFVAYIDVLCDAVTEDYTAVYKGSDQDLLVRVRDGGATPIKTFEGNATFGNVESSIAAIRQSDA